jgi:hypothetical protein
VIVSCDHSLCNLKNVRVLLEETARLSTGAEPLCVVGALVELGAEPYNGSAGIKLDTNDNYNVAQ